ncbi:hypothetical protein [Amycolatopsis sp. NBC_01286]|uniref:hypothetical protein n=1 Tax=Amycolatopsis sp. NBC_01286 TaxID=2903560 RepID=UPI002E0FC801|nr:hypothetical protein OG570_17405 [Amycolatopsis sp. NBC_01286]
MTDAGDGPWRAEMVELVRRGDVARLDHEIGPALVARLRELEKDLVLGGIAEDAFADVVSFAGGA